MEWDFTRNPLAISVMLLITGVNIGLAISMALNSGDVVTLLGLDGRSVLIPAIETEEFNRGRIHIGDADLDGIDLHEILLAVRDAPDADYVKIQGDGEEVRVSKERGFLIVNVDEDRGDRVRVRLPLDVVDALVGEGSEELDLVAALDVLARHHKGDLVSVESDDESIRIWIDNNDSGD